MPHNTLKYWQLKSTITGQFFIIHLASTGCTTFAFSWSSSRWSVRLRLEFICQVWDDLSFVTWCAIQQNMVHCAHIRMIMVSNNTQAGCDFKPGSVSKISSTPLQQPDLLMKGCFAFMMLPHSETIRNWDSPDQAVFFQSLVIQCWWTCVNCSLSFLFHFLACETLWTITMLVTSDTFLSHSEADFEL